MTPNLTECVDLLPHELKADCSNCAALCCYAYEFRSTLGDAFDKPANTRCSMLNAARQCKVYANRESNGLHACIAYECYGAGQWITREYRDGDPEDVLERFRLVRSIHETLAMIALAQSSKAPNTIRVQLNALHCELKALRNEPLDHIRRTLVSKRAITLRTLRATLARVQPRAKRA